MPARQDPSQARGAGASKLTKGPTAILIREHMADVEAKADVIELPPAATS